MHINTSAGKKRTWCLLFPVKMAEQAIRTIIYIGFVVNCHLSEDIFVL